MSFSVAKQERLMQVLVAPHVSEKGTTVADKHNQVVFRVQPDASKTEIKQAVQKIFKVKVADVHTVNNVGKLRRRGRFSGYRPDWKKAYVRLQAGEKMPEYTEM